MKDETWGIWIKEFVGLKPKIYSFFVDNNNEYKKAKGVNRNVVVTISHKKYQNVQLNNKCIRHTMNRIQSKDHRIETYEINKISLSCFDDKIYIQNTGYGRLSFWLPELTTKNSYLFRKAFCQAYCFSFFLVRTAFLSSILF